MRCVTFLAVVCLCITMVLIFGTAMVLMFGMVSLFDFGCPGHLKTKRTETKIKEYMYELQTLLFRVMVLRASPRYSFMKEYQVARLPRKPNGLKQKCLLGPIVCWVPRLCQILRSLVFRGSHISFWSRTKV